MSSNSYKATVISNKENQLKLAAEITSPDEYYFYTTKNFILRLIWDAAQLLDIEAPLSKAISTDQILDADWVFANEDKFIKKVELSETKNYPTKSEFSKMSRSELDSFRKEHGIPSAEYQITLVDEKWGTHLKPGRGWTSAAYNMEE